MKIYRVEDKGQIGQDRAIYFSNKNKMTKYLKERYVEYLAVEPDEADTYTYSFDEYVTINYKTKGVTVL